MYTDPTGLEMPSDTFTTGSMWSQSNIPTQKQVDEVSQYSREHLGEMLLIGGGALLIAPVMGTALTVTEPAAIVAGAGFGFTSSVVVSAIKDGAEALTESSTYKRAAINALFAAVAAPLSETIGLALPVSSIISPWIANAASGAATSASSYMWQAGLIDSKNTSNSEISMVAILGGVFSTAAKGIGEGMSYFGSTKTTTPTGVFWKPIEGVRTLSASSRAQALTETMLVKDPGWARAGFFGTAASSSILDPSHLVDAE